MNTVMNAKDTVSASLAECFVTIGDRRLNFMQAINLEAKFDADAEYLDEDMDFTFEDFDMPETFAMLAGME